MRPEDDAPVWSRLPHESAPAYEAFSRYRDMPGRRSCRKVAAELAKSGALVRRWCATWRWIQRCAEYDREVDRLARERNLRDQLETRRRIGQQLRGKAQSLMLPDIALSKRLTAPDAMQQLEQLPLPELIELAARCAAALPAVVKMELLAAGVSPDVPTQPAEPADDFVTRAIADGDVEVLAAAATLLERVSAASAAPSVVTET